MEIPKRAFWFEGKKMHLESTHIEVEGRHQVIDKWVDAETGEVHKEMPHKLRDLFSTEEKLDERLICQEVSAIFLRDGKTPTKMTIGGAELKKMCEDLYPRTRLPFASPHQDKVEPNTLQAVVTTVGRIEIIADEERDGYRNYMLEDGTILQEVGG